MLEGLITVQIQSNGPPQSIEVLPQNDVYTSCRALFPRGTKLQIWMGDVEIFPGSSFQDNGVIDGSRLSVVDRRITLEELHALLAPLTWHETPLITDLEQVNITDKSGHTTLMDASWKGELSAVHALLDLGAQVDITDENGRTALSHASEMGQTD